jgi:zinc protease
MANFQGRLLNAHLPKLLTGSKYADRMPIGLMDVVRTAPKQAFLDYYYD